MSGLEIEGLTKRFGAFTAVDKVDLSVARGRFVCLLGPSGCGKTTLLRMIAGLEEPSEGRVLLEGEDITGLPTHRRNIGMVFQSLALFTHLSVGQNIAYALRIRGVAAEAQDKRVHELLEMVHLRGFAERPVAKLSGGQRQRVAIARALAHSPRLFLLDEPLSALDAKLREAMQVELRQLQQALGITTVVVTHDQREAMTMADMVVVMGEGRVRQAATPIEVYRRPADAFVAGFVGRANLLDAWVIDAQTIDTPIGRLITPPHGRAAGSALRVLVRPERIEVASAANGATGENVFAAKVLRDRFFGATRQLEIAAGNGRLEIETAMRDDVTQLRVPREAIQFLNAK
jgi:putative spermidine/putrescine transport system ATP-binding protein